MAVDSRVHMRMDLYRQMLRPVEGNVNFYDAAAGLVVPLSGTATATSTTAETTLFPVYGSVVADSLVVKTPMKAETASRKRSRDSVNNKFWFLGEDMSIQIQQQQLEIDRFLAQHVEKVRLEAEERRKRQSRRLIAAIEDGFSKRMRSKDEEIENIVKLNWGLEQKIKSLCLENQIWRDLAQNNEATANALRTNLEQVLAQVSEPNHKRGARLEYEAAEVTEDAESCCGSSGEEEERRRLGSVGVKDKEGESERWCRNCGEEESCVLLLPCRHLCLCTGCGSTLHTCPVCKSDKNASVHVLKY